jgi:hypothetical protein
MIFPPRPKGFERDDTEHGKLYYTGEQLRKYGLRCVEEYKRCNPDPKKESVNPLHRTAPTCDVVGDLMGMFGMSK